MPPCWDSGVLLNLDPTLLPFTGRSNCPDRLGDTVLVFSAWLAVIALSFIQSYRDSLMNLLFGYPGDQGKGPEPELASSVPCRWG